MEIGTGKILYKMVYGKAVKFGAISIQKTQWIKQMINTYPFLTVYGISLCPLRLPHAGLNLWNHVTPNQLQLSVPFLQPIEYHPFERML
jgi:hypothetical protein